MFVIGHGWRHYIYQHSVYPNPNETDNRVSKLNILNLSRAAEISADRIGFWVCGLRKCFTSKSKLASGLMKNT